MSKEVKMPKFHFTDIIPFTDGYFTLYSRLVQASVILMNRIKEKYFSK
jgi:hypothetical protein